MDIAWCLQQQVSGKYFCLGETDASPEQMHSLQLLHLLYVFSNSKKKKKKKV